MNLVEKVETEQARLASLKDENDGDDGINEINGFDIAALDRDETGEWQQVVRRRGHARRSRLPTSAPTYDQDINMVDGDGPNNRKLGRITIDSGAAESVIPPDMLQEVPTSPHQGRVQERTTSQQTVGGCRIWERSTSSSAQERVSAQASSSR